MQKGESIQRGEVEGVTVYRQGDLSHGGKRMSMHSFFLLIFELEFGRGGKGGGGGNVRI